VETYRFDPDLVMNEMDAITTWCQANGLDPKAIPTDAAVRIDDSQITVDVWVLTDGKLRIDPETDRPRRGTTTVPLKQAPDSLESLKPVKHDHRCPRCSQPITGWHGEIVEEDWSAGYREAAVMAERYEPCGCTRIVDVRSKTEAS
jgi:hypothetical protein